MTAYIVMYRDDLDDEGMYVDSVFTNKVKALEQARKKTRELHAEPDDERVCVKEYEIK